MRKAPGSQWTAAAVDEEVLPAASDDPVADDSGPSRVDQRLNEIADELLGRADLTNDDLDDVEHHLRSMRRIAARSAQNHSSGQGSRRAVLSQTHGRRSRGDD